jgi:hypothetical protein
MFIARLFVHQEHQKVTSWLFIKLLALIYFSAFFSLALQIDSLSGPEGIMPLQEQLDGAYGDLGWPGFGFRRFSGCWSLTRIFHPVACNFH